MTRVPDNPTPAQIENAISFLTLTPNQAMQQAGLTPNSYSGPRPPLITTAPDLPSPPSSLSRTDSPISPSRSSTSGSTTNVLVAKKPPLDLSEPILDPETAADMLFQELGGVELADMLSFGTVSGINQRFRVITNMNDWKLSYDPLRLISDQVPGYGGAIQLPINLAEKIPDQEQFIFIERYNPTDVVSDVLLDLVIILENMEPDEELEIQVVSNGKIKEVT